MFIHEASADQHHPSVDSDQVHPTVDIWFTSLPPHIHPVLRFGFVKKNTTTTHSIQYEQHTSTDQPQLVVGLTASAAFATQPSVGRLWPLLVWHSGHHALA